IELSLGGTPSTSFTASSKITANGFNNYVSSMDISLTSKQDITIRNLAKLYHSYDGSKFKEDILNVTISGNKAVVDLGQINPGYAPNDGYVVFYADVEEGQVSPRNFNSNLEDTPLEGLNFTQDRSSVWKSSLANVNPGDQLKFNVYYHNASDDVANNTQIELSLGGTPSTSFTASSKITANGFNNYVSSMDISLTSKQDITIRNLAKLYHSYDGSKFKEDILNVTITGNKAVVHLGQINPGYAPNDGYVVFYADVTKDTTVPPDVEPRANAGPDQTVAPNSKVQLDGSKSIGTKLTYAWTCNNSITLNNPSLVNPTFIVPQNATSGTIYICTLTVTDSNSKTSSDNVQITVKKSESASSGGGGGTPIIYYGGNVEVKLLDVSENNNGSVKLNGKITTCEKDNCEAKFLWGENKENLLNSTEIIKNLKEGDTFSATLKNLKKGKPYYVQIEARLETSTAKDDTIIKFITRPDKPALLKTTLLKDNSVQIDLEKGEGGTIVFIKRGVDMCPTFNDPSAPIIYFGGEKTFIDDATSSNTSYCYRVWMVASDGTDLIFSDSTDSLISTKEIKKEEDKKEEDKKPEKDNDIVITPDKPTPTITYELSLKSFVRNTSKDELDWKKITEAKQNEIVEFYIELENKGNASIKDILILNSIKNGIKEFKNISINNVICSEEALERVFIEELDPHQTVKIRFFGVIDAQIKDKEIVLLTDAYSNKTKSLGESVKIIKLNNGDNAKASLIIKIKEQCKSWLILALVIIILSLIYIILRKKGNSNKSI
ncbi:MAG: hypothetical protein PHX17_00170, partial [Candidatus Pacebacteria bacterium]|nr:hypothetical protein [Candidatus Paceibacterota bacterium]